MTSKRANFGLITKNNETLQPLDILKARMTRKSSILNLGYGGKKGRKTK